MNGLPRPGFKLAYAIPVVCIVLAVTASQTSVRTHTVNNTYEHQISNNVLAVKMVAAGIFEPPTFPPLPHRARRANQW